MYKSLLLILVYFLVNIINAQVYRGVNFNAINFATPVNNNTLMLKATGADVIRLSFGYTPLVNKTPPYAYNLTAFNYLNNALNFCEANNIKVIINPHTTPGTASNYTMNPTDPFWVDVNYHHYLYNLWDTLSSITMNRGDVIYGLDLLNEPALPCCDLQLWNKIADSLTTIIRANDDTHPIIIEPFAYINGAGQYITRLNAMPELVLPDDNNLIVSPHFYNPLGFSHQGVGSNPTGILYPGVINGTYYDSLVLVNRMVPIVNFQQAHSGIRILMGEFSASRAGGLSSNVYIDDLIGTFEAHGWDWTYHEFRGSTVWDAEMPLGSNDAAPRDTNNQRIQTLMSYFRLQDIFLPIEEVIFEVRKQTNENILKWRFLSNENEFEIRIERSSEGINFQEIGSVIQHNGLYDFEGDFIDRRFKNQHNYYRLKIIGNDGKQYFSNVKHIDNSNKNNINVYPSITSDRITVTGLSGREDQILIMNSQGKLIKEYHSINEEISIDISDLKNGLYFLKTEQETFKIIKI